MFNVSDGDLVLVDGGGVSIQHDYTLSSEVLTIS
jgi:hypothetical protein